MLDRVQLRVNRTSLPRSNLHFTNTVVILTPLPVSLPSKTYQNTRLLSIPPATLFDKGLLLTKPVGYSLTPLSYNSIALLRDSIFLSLTKQSFPSWGLTASTKLQAMHRVPRGFRKFVNVSVSLKDNDEGGRKRSKWAMSEDRVGVSDFLLSCGSENVQVPDGVRSELTQVTPSTSSVKVSKAQMPLALSGNESIEEYDIFECVDFVQCIAKDFEEPGEIELSRTVFSGFCSSEMITDVIETARDFVAKGGEWAVVFATPPDAPIVWSNGIGRGGLENAYSPSAEMFILKKSDSYALQMRSGLDIA